MKTFKIFNKHGKEGKITLGEIVDNRAGIEIEVKELEFKGKIVYENQVAYFSRFIGDPNLYLKFKDEKYLKVKNQALIEYVNKLNNNDMYSLIYPFTKEYRANWCD